jgi:hypothetical protein
MIGGMTTREYRQTIKKDGALEQEKLTKTELAHRMKTSRAALDRILDPANPSLTVSSLGKAAAALGRKVDLKLIPA